jgi:hypothetical protein
MARWTEGQLHLLARTEPRRHRTARAADADVTDAAEGITP